MTAPLKQLPVNGGDCVELRKIGDHVSVGRSSLFACFGGTRFIVVCIQNKQGEVKNGGVIDGFWIQSRKLDPNKSSPINSLSSPKFFWLNPSSIIQVSPSLTPCLLVSVHPQTVSL